MNFYFLRRIDTKSRPFPSHLALFNLKKSVPKHFSYTKKSLTRAETNKDLIRQILNEGNSSKGLLRCFVLFLTVFCSKMSNRTLFEDIFKILQTFQYSCFSNRTLSVDSIAPKLSENNVWCVSSIGFSWGPYVLRSRAVRVFIFTSSSGSVFHDNEGDFYLADIQISSLRKVISSVGLESQV